MRVLGLFSVLSANNLLFIIVVPDKKAEQGNISRLSSLLHYHICNCAAPSPTSAKAINNRSHGTSEFPSLPIHVHRSNMNHVRIHKCWYLFILSH